jgi:hypothetical protein
VAYVGATRAIDHLLITFLRSRPSRFLRELALNPEVRGQTDSSLMRQAARLERELMRITKARLARQRSVERIREQFPELQGEEPTLRYRLFEEFFRRRREHRIDEKLAEYEKQKEGMLRLDEPSSKSRSRFERQSPRLNSAGFCRACDADGPPAAVHDCLIV